MPFGLLTKPDRPLGKAVVRPSLPEHIRHMTSDLQECVQVMVELMRGEHKADPRVRAYACDWLVNRVYGKVLDAQVQLQINARDAASAGVGMSDEQLEHIARQLTQSSTHTVVDAPLSVQPSVVSLEVEPNLASENGFASGAVSTSSSARTEDAEPSEPNAAQQHVQTPELASDTPRGGTVSGDVPGFLRARGPNPRKKPI